MWFTSVVTLLLCHCYLLSGKPILNTPSFDSCGGSLELTCNQTGFSGTGFSWKKDGSAVYNIGGDVSGTGRYSQTSTANSFTLKISNINKDDNAAFVCNYNFLNSDPVTVEPYCDATADTISITRNEDNMKVVINIQHIYPSAATVTVTKDGTTLTGTPGTATANAADGDYFDIQWISNDPVEDGTYNFEITVVTARTPANAGSIVKSGITFGGSTPGPGGCSIIICFVGPIVTFGLCLIMVILYICTEILKFIGIYSKEFGLKIGLPSAVIFLIGLLLAILLCLLASGCDDDKGWGTGVSVVLVIVCCPCGSMGVIIIHFKFIGDNSTNHGEINGGAGGQTGRGKSGTDNGPQPGPGGRQIPDRGRQRPDGDNGQHQDQGKPRPLPIPGGGDDGLQKSKTEKSGSVVSKGDVDLDEGHFRPRKLPDIPPTGDKNVRGISANFDEVVPDKKRLTPLGKEAFEVNEEDSPRKKKKKKKKNKEKDASEEYMD